MCLLSLFFVQASDLKLLVQRYEYWAHRLFPKFPFADVVDQVENLGHKKLVQVRTSNSVFATMYAIYCLTSHIVHTFCHAL